MRRQMKDCNFDGILLEQPEFQEEESEESVAKQDITSSEEDC